MSRLFMLVITCLLCSGCGLTTRQAQNLADGLAGIEAVQPQVVTNPSASLILMGAHDHIAAVAIEARETLPPPLRSPAMIAADATGYADDARYAKDDADLSIPWWGWLAGIGTSFLAVLRFVPGAGGAVADTAWRLLAPTATKEQDRTRDICAQGFTELVGVIERLRDDHTIAHLKSKVSTQVSSSVHDAISDLVHQPRPSG
jgi:hypothetical protein